MLKRKIRTLRLVTRTASLAFSLALTGTMAATLGKYLSTKDHIVNGRSAWAKNTKLWPTLMLFTVAFVSLLLDSVIMMAYLRSVKAANKTAYFAAYFTGVVIFAHVALWVTTTALYRYGKDTNGVSNDLWGWTCSEAAQKIQAEFAPVVHFDSYCSLQVRDPARASQPTCATTDHLFRGQTGSFGLSILQAIVLLLTLTVWMFAYRRAEHKRQMKLGPAVIPVQTF